MAFLVSNASKLFAFHVYLIPFTHFSAFMNCSQRMRQPTVSLQLTAMALPRRISDPPVSAAAARKPRINFKKVARYFKNVANSNRAGAGERRGQAGLRRRSEQQACSIL